MLVRGPRIVAEAFVAITPGISAAAVVAVLALELAALAGLLFAVRRQPLPVAAALFVTLAIAALIAWLRPATPFYMTYALLPFVAALGALGLYAVDPVSTNYVFGSPLLNRAELALSGGRTLVIETTGNGADTPYIQSVTWNGQPWRKSWISHAELAKGGTLSFAMGRTPDTAFGRDAADRPPSMKV
jgi:hypothetical protein